MIKGGFPVLMCAAALAGCFGGAKRTETIRSYQIDYDPPAASGERLPVVLSVAPFRTTAAYDRKSIVYRDSRYTSDAYFYHRWAALPAQMLADLVTRDLTVSGRYEAVQQGPSLLSPDYVVQTQIEEIEEIPQSSGCAAHLLISVVLARAHARSAGVVFQKTYSQEEAARCNAPQELAESMSRAAAAISQQLQSDLADAIRRDRAP